MYIHKNIPEMRYHFLSLQIVYRYFNLEVDLEYAYYCYKHI